ncbi:hypothetical protein PUN28_007655 [Cardiocondyla obscurior]|uniref:Uncharacterized protein n=1 Tax=Cardiocondyla obscurior TaxID=286306 RepID=A0AAW2G6Z8_9HYME
MSDYIRVTASCDSPCEESTCRSRFVDRFREFRKMTRHVPSERRSRPGGHPASAEQLLKTRARFPVSHVIVSYSPPFCPAYLPEYAANEQFTNSIALRKSQMCSLTRNKRRQIRSRGLTGTHTYFFIT